MRSHVDSQALSISLSGSCRKKGRKVQVGQKNSIYFWTVDLDFDRPTVSSLLYFLLFVCFGKLVSTNVIGIIRLGHLVMIDDNIGES